MQATRQSVQKKLHEICQVGWIGFCLLIGFISTAYAEETNIGFKTGAERTALKAQYPMCDEFMNVKWIDKTKKIKAPSFDFQKDQITFNGVGVVKYQADIKGKRRTVYALAFGRDIRFKITKKQYSSPEFYQFVRNSLMDYNGMALRLRIIATQKQWTNFFPTHSARLTNQNINICMINPDNRGFFVEFFTRWHQKCQDSSHTETICKLLAKHGYSKEQQSRAMDFAPRIDLNQDGIYDYLFGNSVIYSNTRTGQYNYYDLMDDQTFKEANCNNGPLFFKSGSFYFDGKPECNITKQLKSIGQDRL
ncbi:hypothetical protein [Hydrogenovibrio sp. JE_KL2]|uniref:hypothetical protein n=1 Tax=Hydrogenovibrio sp. JE_KL2 TaxID=2651188 RepID=UPI00128B3BB0|nr:hypothetical protein [Hydrogenovibrio sp. JE_KL2]MPQ76479.1 hypothetical protein [Hydrogenovibrio sp. JE_KL2]